jgi:NADH-quinone oxidoreductase subunit A
MPLLMADSVPLWPLAAYFGAVVLLATGILGLSYVLGERHRERATGVPYESGIMPTGSARLRMPVEFYLVALFFVIFDLEAVFLFAWAIAARQLGWAGYIEVLVFVGVLVLALVYLWRQGALDWAAPRPTNADEKRSDRRHDR